MTDLNSPQPLPGASPAAAVQRFFAKSFVLTGRASRSEYWWPTLIFTAGIAAADIAARHYDRARHPEAYTSTGTFRRLIPMVAEPAAGVEETEAERTEREAHVRRAELTSVLATAPIILATAAPSFTVSVRRLHDINLSGQWMWLNAVPVAGNLASMVLSALPAKPEGARFDS